MLIARSRESPPLHQLLVPLSLVIAVGSSAPLRAEAENHPGKGQLACQADIHRLCDDVFPDIDQVALCLVEKRKELSISCATALAKPTLEEQADY